MPKCPTCKKPIEWKDNPWRPFCSERCQLIDFGRWAEEEYRVPGQEIEAAEPSEPPPADKIDEENPYD
ncbi:MAG: DNA gyrase inhibitor YacG [Pyrinomonadaceae bacterium]